MKRFDLRGLKGDFLGRMGEIIDSEIKKDEIGIFIFEVGDFSGVHNSANLAHERGCEVMNSLRFNEVDWTIIIKKTREST